MKQTLTICREEIKQSLKNKKVLFLIFVYTLILFYGMKKSVFFSTNFKLMLMEIFGFQGVNLPYPLIFFYFASIVLLPFFSLLLSYDSLPREIYKETIRPLASIADRKSIVLGKLFGIIIINISVNLVIYLFAIIYAFFAAKELFLFEGLIFWVYLSIYSIYFVSLAVMASSFLSNPQKSLFLCASVYLLPLFFFVNKYLLAISPYNYYMHGFYLVSGDISKVLAPALLLIFFSILFTAVSMLAFQRRDL